MVIQARTNVESVQKLMQKQVCALKNTIKLKKHQMYDYGENKNEKKIISKKNM